MSRAVGDTVKRLIRHGIDVLAAGVGALRAFERSARLGVTALMYHRVLPDALCRDYPLPSLVVPESHFAAQVEWLARNTDVRTVVDAVRCPDRPARPVVCVTFDDGYHDNADIAAPILESHGVRGTFYVTTGFVGGALPMWFDLAALHWRRDAAACALVLSEECARPSAIDGLPGWMSLLKALGPEARARVIARLSDDDPMIERLTAFRPMTWDQVRALHGRGHEIGNHTLTHPILPQLSGDALAREIRGARDELEAKIGAKTAGFCYPNGDHDDATVAAVAAAGHEYACTTLTGLNAPGYDALRIRRRMVDPRHVSAPSGRPSVLAFRSEIFGMHDRLRSML